MQESRKVSIVERVLSIIFSGKTFLGLFLPVATIYFRGCSGGPARPPEIFTGWQLMPHNGFLYAIPLVAAIALVCALFNRRLQNVLFALFWSAVKVILAVTAIFFLVLSEQWGFHGDGADPWIGFWLVLAGMSGVFVLWWVNLLANLGPFRRFWKERKTGKAHGKLLTSVIIGEWFFGLAFPVAAFGGSAYSLIWGGEHIKYVVDVALLAVVLLLGVGFSILFFALKFGLRRGQAWAAHCHILVSAVFAGLSVLILIDIGKPAKDNTPRFIIFSAIAAWFAYTILAIILTRKSFKRAPQRLEQKGSDLLW